MLFICEFSSGLYKLLFQIRFKAFNVYIKFWLESGDG